jgi:hypothetical protein
MNKTRLLMLLVVVLLSLALVGMALAADNTPQKENPPQGDNTALGTSPSGLAGNPAPEALWPGPDGYGYLGSSFTYNWVDISSSGTLIGISGDDVSSGALDIGFTFPFYGASYTQFYAQTNGTLAFGAATTSYSNQCPLPNASLPDNIIPIVWDDLNMDGAAWARFQTFASCPVGAATQCLVVEFANMDTLGGATAGTWEAILYSSGDVILQYQDVGTAAGASSTSGIEGNNAPADYGLTYACNTASSLTPNTAIKMSIPVGVLLQPDTIDAQGCARLPQNHPFTIYNFTGVETTINLTYSMIAGSGDCAGPSSVLLANKESASIIATLAPRGAPGDVVTCQIHAEDASNPSYFYNSNINKTVVLGFTEWQQIADEPNNGRLDNVVAGYAGLVWSITGYGYDANVRNYDPILNAWNDAGSTPPFGINYARSGCQAGNTVYMYGDTTTVGFTGLWSYNMDTNVWAQVTPSGTPPAQTGIWAPAWVRDPTSGYCFMTGGATSPGSGNLTTTYVYDPATNAWRSPLPNFTTMRDFHAAFIYDRPSDQHHMLCVAGGNNGAALASTQCFDFVTSAWDAENVDLGELPGDWWGMGYADKWHLGTEHQLWLLGGVVTDLLSTNAWYFDVNTGNWVDGGPHGATATYRTSATTLNNEIYKLGGSIAGLTPTGIAYHHLQQLCPADIEVNTPPLHAFQPTDTLTDKWMTICNIGGAALDWSIVEVPGSILGAQEVTVQAPAEQQVATVPSAEQPVDLTKGVPAPEGSATPGAEVPFGGGHQILDDFNRANGPIGSGWTVHDGFCNVSNNAAVCGGTGRATINNIPVDGNFAEADVAVNGTALQYTGLLLNYGAGVNNLFIKVQEQNASGLFHDAACYTGNNSDSFGLGYFPLTSPFSTAHMAATRVGSTVTIMFTNIDGGAQPDQTYVCDGAPPPEGSGIGILGYEGSARLDNFGGPANIPWLLESPISGTTLSGECSDVDITFNSTGLAAGNYFGNLRMLSSDPIEPSLSVPAALTVINATMTMDAPASAFAGDLFTYAIDLNLSEFGGTAMLTDTLPAGVQFADNLDCNLGTCSYDSGTNAVKWNFTGLNTLAAYPPIRANPLPYVPPANIPFSLSATGSVPAANKSATAPQDILWDQYVPSSMAFASQDFEPAWDAFDIYAADDFQNTSPWYVDSILTAGGWNSPVDLHTASAIHWYIYADNGGEPAGVPGDGNEYWSITLSPTDPQVVLESVDARSVLLNLNVPINLPPGTWWLVYYVSMEFNRFGQYGWQATTAPVWGVVGEQNNPGGGFGYPPGWNSNSYNYDYAFRLDGTISQASNVTITFDVRATDQVNNVTNTADLWWNGLTDSASASTHIFHRLFLPISTK